MPTGNQTRYDATSGFSRDDTVGTYHQASLAVASVATQGVEGAMDGIFGVPSAPPKPKMGYPESAESRMRKASPTKVAFNSMLSEFLKAPRDPGDIISVNLKKPAPIPAPKVERQRELSFSGLTPR